MRRALSLYLPRWPIQRIRRTDRRLRAWADARRPPMMLYTADGGRRVVVHACEAALEAGVRAGMTLSHARALLGPGALRAQKHRPHQDRSSLRALALWAMRFSPLVAMDDPDGLMLDITGCQRLFGGEERLMDLCVGRLGALGLTTQAAIAPTPGCAWAVARYGQDRQIIPDGQASRALEPLPVAALRIEPQDLEALAQVAIDRVGHLLAIPRPQLAERFGSGLLLRLDQALGRSPEVIEPVRYRQPLRLTRRFEEPIRRWEGLKALTREMLDDLCRMLTERCRGAGRLVLTVRPLGGELIVHRIELSRPAREAGALWRLLLPRIERLNMGWGVERITLEAPLTQRIAHRQDRAWDEPQDLQGSVHELVDQLVNRLGSERVCQMRPVETYCPERSFERYPALRRIPEGQADPRLIDADRPWVLYEHPQPLMVTSLNPQGPVISMRRQGEVLEVVSCIGPERITPRWWLGADDSRVAMPRDYFKLQDHAGRWWWVYRQVGTARWFLHGLWA